MNENMFTVDGWEKVTYCKDCRRSYTPVKVIDNQIVIESRYCELTKRIVKEKGYCDAAIPKED